MEIKQNLKIDLKKGKDKRDNMSEKHKIVKCQI